MRFPISSARISYMIPASKSMKAMVLDPSAKGLLTMRHWPIPGPGPGQILVRVLACGVCRTDLHVVDRELSDPKENVIPGHEIVGEVMAAGPQARTHRIGSRVGIPWLGWTCGRCRFCLNQQENLCEKALFTGYTLDGGYAEFTVADERFCFPLSEKLDAAESAPLLCAGLIGYRSYRKVGNAERIGLYGFGAAAHLLTQWACYENRKIFAFTRPGDREGQDFAKKLGAHWAGDSDQMPPEPLDAAILFAPVGKLVPLALKAVDKGGIVVCGGIHMSDIPSFPYSLLWEERRLCSVANLTRQDGREYLARAPEVPVRSEATRFPLGEANAALDALRQGKLQGAAVLLPGLES